MTNFYGSISGPILNKFPLTKYFTKLKINKTCYEYDMPSTHLVFNFIITKIIVAIGLKAFNSLNRSYFENLFFFFFERNMDMCRNYK